jgi:hypothetical protein
LKGIRAICIKENVILFIECAIIFAHHQYRIFQRCIRAEYVIGLREHSATMAKDLYFTGIGGGGIKSHFFEQIIIDLIDSAFFHGELAPGSVTQNGLLFLGLGNERERTTAGKQKNE